MDVETNGNSSTGSTKLTGKAMGSTIDANAQTTSTSAGKRTADSRMEDNDDDDDDDDEDEEENVGLTARSRADVDMDDEEEDEDEEEGGDEPTPLLSDKDKENFEFVFRDPSENDFSFVRSLVLHGGIGSVPGVDVHASSIADLVVNQKAVGTMIKASSGEVEEEAAKQNSEEADDDQVYAFSTILGLEEHKESPAIQAVQSYIKNNCPAARRNALNALLRQGKTALLVNERIVNLPSQLIPPLHSCLLDDLTWTRENEEEAGAFAGQFDFANIVVVAPVSKLTDSVLGAGGSSKRTKQVDEFMRFEEEFLVKKSKVNFRAQLQAPKYEGQGAVPQSNRPEQAVIAFLEWDKYEEAVQEMQALEFSWMQ